MKCKQKSSLKLVSNIILKETKNLELYIPFELKPKEYKDVRVRDQLSPKQKKQHDKELFRAKEIRESFERFPNKIENYEMCRDCEYKDRCF